LGHALSLFLIGRPADYATAALLFSLPSTM